MDSTPAQISEASAAVKLPIKRRAAPTDPNYSIHRVSDLSPTYFPPNPTSKTHSGTDACDPRHPPYKFHRIWTEPDEIRFLQGLLNSGSENLCFPRDLNDFYVRFACSMSQPYTKSQLSEKLRRLRKKFRVISTKLSKGFDQFFLAPHDRALYELSKQLWHPDFVESSPFRGGNRYIKAQKSDLIGIKVNFIPSFQSDLDPNLVENLEPNCENNEKGADDYALGDVGLVEEVKLRDVNVEFEKEQDIVEEVNGKTAAEVGTVEVTMKAIMDVFDESLKEVRMLYLNKGSSLNYNVNEELNRQKFERRWQEQRVAELEALGRRMRLVFEQSLLQRH